MGAVKAPGQAWEDTKTPYITAPSRQPPTPLFQCTAVNLGLNNYVVFPLTSKAAGCSLTVVDAVGHLLSLASCWPSTLSPSSGERTTIWWGAGCRGQWGGPFSPIVKSLWFPWCCLVPLALGGHETQAWWGCLLLFRLINLNLRLFGCETLS